MPSFFDSDQALRQFLSNSEGGLPAYMRDVFDAPATSHLKSAAFAGATRNHPCYDRVSTYASAVNLLASGEQSSGTYERIKVAARVHGIEDDLAAAERALGTPVVEPVLEKAACALSVDMGDTHLDLYPTGSLYDLEESARGLQRDILDNRIPIDWAKEAAEHIVEAAKTYSDASLPDSVVELGTPRLPDLEKAASVDSFRSRRLGLSTEDAEIFSDLVKAAAEDPDALPAIVELYTELDSRLQIKYSSVIPNPYTVFYGGASLDSIEKLASEVVVIDDVLVPLAVVATVKPSRIKAAFRKEAADMLLEVIKEPAAIASIKLAKLEPGVRSEFLDLLLA